MRPRPSIRLALLALPLLAPALVLANKPGPLALDAAGALDPPSPPGAPVNSEAAPARNESGLAPSATPTPALDPVPAAVPAPPSEGSPSGSADVRKLDAEVARAEAAAKGDAARSGPAAGHAEAVAIPTPAEVARATPEEAGRMFAAVEARLKALNAPDARGKAENKPIRDVLEERKRRLVEWRAAVKEHHEAEHPEPSPERQAADGKADLEKCKALLDQAAASPDAPLPERFRASIARGSHASLAEMKEAIDAARAELADRTAKLEALRAEAGRAASGETATLRARRDQLHQDFSTLTARRGEREEAVASATSPEARDLAAERLANFEWEARAVAERLDTQEARIALAARRLDLSALLLQAGEARVRLCRMILERMEWHYSALAEVQRKALDRAVAREQARAALANDPILRHRAQRRAELLELESQVVSHEKALAATDGLSLQDQQGLADASEIAFAKLRKMLEDGTLTTLEALRFKNEYRRIGTERDRVVRTELAASAAELASYENALSDAEIDLANDPRDDRFEADALVEKVAPARKGEATAMLDELEVKHRGLLERRCNALKSLAERAEATHAAVIRRVRLLDQENAFIRTHIFWVRDAEPVGKATLIRARGESGRLIRALVALAGRAFDRGRWGKASVQFVAAATLAVLLPLPLWFGRRWLDRLRLSPAA